MKKICALILTIFCFSIAGCSKDKEVASAGTDNVVTDASNEKENATDTEDTVSELPAVSYTDKTTEVLADDSNVKITMTDLKQSVDTGVVSATISADNKLDKEVTIQCIVVKVGNSMVDSDLSLMLDSKSSDSAVISFRNITLNDFKNVTFYIELSETKTGNVIQEYSPLVFEDDTVVYDVANTDSNSAIVDNDLIRMTLNGAVSENTEHKNLMIDNETGEVVEDVNSLTKLYNVPLLIENKSQEDLIVTVGYKKIEEDGSDNGAYLTKPVFKDANNEINVLGLVEDPNSEKINLTVSVYKPTPGTTSTLLFEEDFEVAK